MSKFTIEELKYYIAGVISTYPPHDREHPENCLPISENIITIPIIFKAPEMLELLKSRPNPLTMTATEMLISTQEWKIAVEQLLKEIEG